MAEEALLLLWIYYEKIFSISQILHILLAFWRRNRYNENVEHKKCKQIEGVGAPSILRTEITPPYTTVVPHLQDYYTLNQNISQSQSFSDWIFELYLYGERAVYGIFKHSVHALFCVPRNRWGKCAQTYLHRPWVTGNSSNNSVKRRIFLRRSGGNRKQGTAQKNCLPPTRALRHLENWARRLREHV